MAFLTLFCFYFKRKEVPNGKKIDQGLRKAYGLCSIMCVVLCGDVHILLLDNPSLFTAEIGNTFSLSSNLNIRHPLGVIFFSPGGHRWVSKTLEYLKKLCLARQNRMQIVHVVEEHRKTSASSAANL